LTNEERVVYEIVKNSGNVGIWVKDLIRTSNLHRQIVSKCVSKLEGRKMIKGVKPVKVTSKQFLLDRGRCFF
jgi:DNA-directed RNA polymerase III subunit RPC6